MNKEYANYLLNKTIDDYNNIAAKFSSTRLYLSDDIMALKKYARHNDSVLDLGCGNGRLVELFREMEIKYTGGDSSGELIKIARERNPDKKFIILDPITLNFPDNAFDVVYCLSMFHHIPSTELRIDYLKEIRRVLKPKGLLVLTVWNLWNRPGTVWSILKSGFFHPKLDLNDIFLPFKENNGKALAMRYIHCFRDVELEKLLFEAGFNIRTIEDQKRGKKAENANFLAVAWK